MTGIVAKLHGTFAWQGYVPRAARGPHTFAICHATLRKQVDTRLLLLLLSCTAVLLLLL